MTHSIRLAILAASFAIGITPLVHADDWMQWRGPTNDGICTEKGLPTTWSTTKNVAWKLDLPGKGSSTPIILGKQIFLTAVEDGNVIFFCVSTDGKLMWKSKVGPIERKDIRAGEGNDASSTPCTDGKHVFVYTGAGDFAALDLTGKEIWKFNAQKRYGTFSIQHGMHITPLLHEDRLYMALLTNGKNNHHVIAIDKATGNDVWKVARKSDAVSESREAYTSPVLWKNGKELNLVILGCDYATGHSLKDGSELWRLRDINPGGKNKGNHRIIASPVAHGDLLIVPTCRGLSLSAVKQGAAGSFGAKGEFDLWRIKSGSPDVVCPLVIGGLVYLVPANGGSLLCLEADTGKQVYSESLTNERYRASPIYADGKIYLVGRDTGAFSVVKAGPKFELLASNRLPDIFTASPAVSQGRLYLRGFQTLYAISEGGK
jgi:outer membrane protein assembly factor BamB